MDFEEITGEIPIPSALRESSVPVEVDRDATDASWHRGARRQHRRWSLDATISLRIPRRVEGITLNASRGGLRIAVDRPLPEGEPLRVHVASPEGHMAHETAHVVWQRPVADGYVAGLAFERESDSFDSALAFRVAHAA